MASFTEKIRLLFEVDDKGSFGRLKRDINAAEGATGKLKAGASGLKDMLKQNMVAAATAAGSALVAFGVKSVMAFQDAAIEAGKFADATGVSVEQASRLIEVAGDVGVEVSAIQGAVQKFNKAVADGKVDGFADSLVRAKDGSIDAYESFINTATAIGKIKDPTERAKAAQQAFGKSYGEIAELMQMDAEDLRAALNDVSDAKVIDENELRRAKEFRAMLDNLNDRLEDIQLTVGERLVPRLQLMAEAVEEVGDAADRIPDGGLLFGFDQKDEDKAFTIIGLNDGLAMSIGDVIEKSDEVADAFDDTGSAADDVGADLADLDKAATSAANATRNLTDEYKRLTDSLSDEEAWLGIEEAIDDYKDKVNEAGASNRDKRRALIDLKQSLIDYLSSLEGVPVEKQTEILALIDQEKFDEAELKLSYLARQRNVAINPTTGGQLPNVSSGINGRRAAGGPVAAGGAYLVGENGPEILQMGGAGGNVIPNSRLGAPTYVNVNVKADPNGFVQALKQYERLNGTRWRR